MAEQIQIHKVPKPTKAVKPLAMALKYLCNDWFSSRKNFECGLSLEPYLQKCTTADQLLTYLELLYREITTGLKVDSPIRDDEPSSLIRFNAFDNDEGCSCFETGGFNTINDDFVAAYEAFLAFSKEEQAEAAWLVVFFWNAKKTKFRAA